MTYATGSATTTANLMDAVLAFAVANAGMTEVVRRTETISSISRTVVCLQKGSSYFWFYWSSNEVRGMPATGSGGSTWATVTGRPTNDSRLFPLAEPYTSYHLFTEGNVVHAAFETSAGWWQHMSFGNITKVGSWTGGHYVYMQNVDVSASFFNNPVSSEHRWLFKSLGMSTSSSINFTSGQGSFIHAVHNSKNYGAFDGSSTTHTNYNTIHPSGFMVGIFDQVLTCAPSAFNNRSPAFPVNIFLRDNASGGSNLLRLAGSVPSVRILNIKNLNAKDLINTDWMVFPLQSKNLGSSGNYVNSGNYGVAYKK
jgi:hypothetical protein